VLLGKGEVIVPVITLAEVTTAPLLGNVTVAVEVTASIKLPVTSEVEGQPLLALTEYVWAPCATPVRGITQLPDAAETVAKGLLEPSRKRDTVLPGTGSNNVPVIEPEADTVAPAVGVVTNGAARRCQFDPCYCCQPQTP
jgi:hypothetical protein